MVKDKHAHIGHIAGLIYHCLERKGKPMSLLDVSLTIRKCPVDVLLALGWLSREGKVRIWRELIAIMAELKKH
ncbi:MAG: winged helix-turn-helix domain-containing protein [Candidatus Altiarchaeota archaeon]